MLKTTLLFISIGAFGASLLGSQLHSRLTTKSDKAQSDLKVDVNGSRQLSVRIPLGNVTLIADGRSELTVHVERTVRGPLNEMGRRWLKDSYLTADNKNGVLTVKDHPFGKDSLSGIDKSNHTEGKGTDLELKVQIHVPKDLATKVSVTAGEALIQGHFQSIAVDVSAGTLTTKDAVSVNRMDLAVGVGTLVSKSITPQTSGSSLSVGAGEVRLALARGSSADVTAEVGVGKITGLPASSKKEDGIQLGDQRHVRVGNGGTKVNISVGTGTVSVSSEGSVALLSSSSDAATNEADKFDDDVVADSGDVQGALNQANQEVEAAEKELKREDFELKLDDEDFKHGQSFNNDKLDRELQNSLKKLDPMIRDILKSIRPEIERAMKHVKPEIERELLKSKSEIKRALKDVEPEIDRAIREAMKEVDRAMKEIHTSDKPLNN